jgi:hypothetical protein
MTTQGHALPLKGTEDETTLNYQEAIVAMIECLGIKALMDFFH